MSEQPSEAPKGAKFILSLATLLLGWGVLELGVRLVAPGLGTIPPPVPEHMHLPWIVTDPMIGWVNKPGFAGRQVKSNQFDVAITIDSFGARRAGPPPEGAFNRLLLVGDSFSFGHGVNDGETFSALLETLLERAEVMNAACVGTGHDQQYLLLKEWIGAESRKPAPTGIVWGFSSADIPRNTVTFRRLADPRTGLDYGKPRFVLERGRLVLTRVPTPPPSEVEAALRAYVAERETARSGVSRLLRRSRVIRVCWDWVADKAEQLPLAEAIAAEFVGLCREQGKPLLIVNLPVRRWLRTKNPLNIVKRRMTDRLLRKLAEEHGARVVDCTPAFLEEPDLDTLFIQDGHYSPAGHAVVAEVLAEALKQP